MGLSINFRSDLAKLSDAELATRLETAWNSYEAANKLKKSWWSRWSFLGSRGPIRHPGAYRFLAALRSGAGGEAWLLPLFALLSIRSKSEESVRRLDDNASMHIDLCEINDIVEEIERRVSRRQGTEI
ncbi:MAG TPA: hypothetical protein VFB68_15545 [Xanthobacteraceae bacterium]|nr:hypothetical protein [Xanthobacteraceae bacterium]